MTEVILNTRQTRKFTVDERKRIAAGWRSSGLSQQEYASQHGIKSRTLRLWIREYAPALATPDEIREAGRRVLLGLRHAAAQFEHALNHLGVPAGFSERDEREQHPTDVNSSPLALKKFSFD